MANIYAQAEKAFDQLMADRSKRLLRIDDYIKGDHDDPFIPETADHEFRLLAKRCKTNWVELLCSTPAQAMYVDSFRRGGKADAGEVQGVDSKEMQHWHRSRMDSRQIAIHREAIAYGLAYTRTYRGKDGKTYTKGLSPLRTITIYEDPTTDLDPIGALYVRSFGDDEDDASGVWYDNQNMYPVKRGQDGKWTSNGKTVPHFMSQCPITRFAPWLDLSGRADSLAWRLIEPQNRYNQTIFDLLMVQSYTSFEVRTVSGMVPPIKMELDDETGDMVPILDADGRVQPDMMALNAKRWMFAEDADTKFGSLPGGDLSGILAAAESNLKTMSAISRTPPHFLLGQIANVSADALQAAQTALLRMVDEIQHAMDVSWERVFRLGAELDGDMAAAEDYTGEVVWKDIGGANLAQHGDALSKFAEIGVPARGLWRRIPGVTDQELKEWAALQDEADHDKQAFERVMGSGVEQRLNAQRPTAPVPAATSNPAPTPNVRPFRDA